MRTQPLPYAFFEKKFVPIADAKVSVMTNALQFGTGFFGGIRGYYDADKDVLNIFRLEDHYNRFFKSANILGCALPYSKEELIDITKKLVQKNNPKTDSYFRPYAYVGHTELTPDFAGITLNFALYMITLGEYLPLSKGLSVCISSWQRINDNSMPSRGKVSGGYINSALARKEATDGGFDEAIMLNKFGYVAEGSAENFFMVRDGILITPSAGQGILEGITRRTILQLARDLGIETIERPIELSELYVADEVFLTGTGCQVAWVEQIEKRVVGEGKIGPITEKLREVFFRTVRGKEKKYHQWVTTIKL